MEEKEIETRINEVEQKFQKKNQELKNKIEKLEKQKTNKLDKNPEENISRRQFLKKAGIGTAGLAALMSPVSAQYFIRDDSFSVQTSNDGGSTLNEGLFVDQNQNVNIPNGDLNIRGNRAATRSWTDSNFNDYEDNDANNAIDGATISSLQIADRFQVSSDSSGREDVAYKFEDNRDGATFYMNEGFVDDSGGFEFRVHDNDSNFRNFMKFYPENESVEIPNGPLNMKNNNISNVNQINGQNADDLGGGVPRGSIIMWNGDPNDVPDGWTLCDGDNGAPDLRNRFVVGAGDEYDVNENGGEKEVQLDVSEMPSHSHEYFDSGGEGSWDSRAGGLVSNWEENTAPGSSVGWNDDFIQGAGGDEAHENRPPYYALAFIMKL